MKLIVLALSLILLVNGQTILAELDSIAEKSSYGKLFKELLSLKMKNQKVDEAIELISVLLKQLRDDQQTDDIESLQKQAGFEVDIQVLQGQLEISRGQLRAANQAVMDITAENAQMLRSKLSLSKQIEELNGKEEELREARSEEEKNYDARQFSTQKVVDALNDIIKRLTDAVLGQSFTEIERKELVTKIKNELGHNNPIAMLISLTSKFDAKTVTGIIERLETLRSAVLASVLSDEQAESQAKLAFQAILLQVNDVRNRLSNDLTETVSRLRRREVEYAIAFRQSNELQQQIPQNEELLATIKRQSELHNTVYQNRKRKRAQEIEVVEAALQLVRKAAMSQ